MEMKKPVYLRCLDVEHNHYKYYRMIPINDSMFKAEYGREGSNPQVKEYPMSKWDSTYRSKIGKGYVDKSEHFVLETTGAAKVDNSRTAKDGTIYAEIPDAEVKRLVNTLLDLSKKTVAANYNISAKHVTQKMIDDAQDYINKMSDAYLHISQYGVANALDRFNRALVELLNTIPRKASTKMQDELVYGTDETGVKIRMSHRIMQEEGLLDNMRTCVTAAIIDNRQVGGVDEKKSKAITLLEALGLEISLCDDTDMKRIKGCFRQRDKAVGLDKKIIKAFRVNNKATAERFKNFKDKNRDGYKRFPQELLWHGSRNENWWSIINNGLKIRPSNAVYTGSMFGDGLYFATSAQKSYGYTSSSSAYWTRERSDMAIMALFDVAVGNQLDTDNNYGDFRTMTWGKIRSKKDKDGKPYHSVFAHAGNQLRNDELIMYNSDQMTIKYLVLFRG